MLNLRGCKGYIMEKIEFGIIDNINSTRIIRDI